MQKLLFIDSQNDIKLTYQDIFETLNNGYSGTLENPRTYFSYLLYSLLNSVDMDLRRKEEEISIPATKILYTEPALFSKTISNSRINFILSSSGTSGIRKVIQQPIQRLLKNVKYKAAYRDCIWGLAFNPLHIAAVQVILTALINTNTIVQLYKKQPNVVFEALQKNKVTHLSATPSFYRQLLTGRTYSGLKHATLGGEMSNKQIVEDISRVFPNAQLSNLYATTETGTILRSKNAIFELDEECMKVENNQLYLHRSLYQKKTENEWCATGDLVEIVSKQPLQIQFLGRNTRICNVGGENVILNLVNERILQIPEVKMARTYSKENAVVGNIVLAEVVLKKEGSLSEKQLKNLLRTSLEDFEVPRIIKFVQTIAVTENNKVTNFES